MTRVQAVTEIKNQLRRKKEQKGVEDYKKLSSNDTYQGDGTEWIIDKPLCIEAIFSLFFDETHP